MVVKTVQKIYFSFILACCVQQLTAQATLATSKGFLQPRPSSGNIAREMMMESNDQHRLESGWFGEFTGTAFYQRYWNQGGVQSGLGAFPFWSGSNTMTIGNNTQATTTSPLNLANIDAYQFGLGPVVPGQEAATITLNPIFYQAGVDVMFIIGSSGNQSGFYAKVKVPLAIAETTYQLTEERPLTAVPYPAGTLSRSSSPVADPATSMSEAFMGFKYEQLAGNGDYTPMNYGLIDNVSRTVIRLADFELTAGYNYIFNHHNSITIGARMSAPSGNKAEGIYMIEPIVGRGGNYGLGGYIAGHFEIWNDAEHNRMFLKIMGDALHLFETNTMRSYDLQSAGQGSRYLLVANYLNNGYQQEIQNLINYTTLNSLSSFSAEVDVAIALTYAWNHGWSWDIGYEYYGRSAENLSINDDFSDQTYAILGRQGVGLITSGITPSTLCQPTAKINSSVARQDSAGVPSALVVDATIPNNRIAFTDLDVQAAAQAAYQTSKAFTKISYEWKNSDYMPFFGIIADCEFSHSLNNALPQWAITVVSGVTF